MLSEKFSQSSDEHVGPLSPDGSVGSPSTNEATPDAADPFFQDTLRIEAEKAAMRCRDVLAHGSREEQEAVLDLCVEIFRKMPAQHLVAAICDLSENLGNEIYSEVFRNIEEGDMKTMMANVNRAEKFFLLVSECNPHHIGALRARANIAWNRGDYQEVREIYQNMVQVDPRCAEAMVGLAEYYFRIEKDIVNCVKYLDAAWKIDPSHPGFGYLLNEVRQSVTGEILGKAGWKGRDWVDFSMTPPPEISVDTSLPPLKKDEGQKFQIN